MANLFTIDFNSLSNEERYSAISDFSSAQPNESSRHDFKALWGPGSIEDVAGFANTFGGILIIGVEKGQKDLTAKLVGVDSERELTTGIASSIATNITPTPFYEIMECYNPSESNKRFCVVRVRSGPSIHMVTKKGTKTPVFVRNQDETVPADAAQLRMMIERERQTSSNIMQDLLFRSQALLDQIDVSHAAPASRSLPGAGGASSGTFFKLVLVAMDPVDAMLDFESDQKLINLIYRYYPRIHSCLNGTTASEHTDRGEKFFDYRWFHQNLAYECRWRITSSIDMAHAVQIRVDDKWSIVDLVVYAILFLKISEKWWQSLGFLGEGLLLANASVQGLPIREAGGFLIHGFSPGTDACKMSSASIVLNPHPQLKASGHIRTNFASVREDVPRIVTTLMNSLLRSLGHGVRKAEFEEGVRAICNSIDIRHHIGEAVT